MTAALLLNAPRRAQIKATVQSVAANLLTHGWDSHKVRAYLRVAHQVGRPARAALHCGLPACLPARLGTYVGKQRSCWHACALVFPMLRWRSPTARTLTQQQRRAGPGPLCHEPGALVLRMAARVQVWRRYPFPACLSAYYCMQARGWTRGVAGAFLAPFSLGDLSASTTCALGTRDDVIDDIFEKVIGSPDDGRIAPGGAAGAICTSMHACVRACAWL